MRPRRLIRSDCAGPDQTATTRPPPVPLSKELWSCARDRARPVQLAERDDLVLAALPRPVGGDR